tara:strand:+ start:7848 stop:8501 length:654 start_codon:yes stop_codon:yes gene_type:complete
MLGIGAGAAMVKPDLLFGVEPGIAVPSKGLAKSWVVYSGSGIGCGQAAVMAQEFVVSPTFDAGLDPHEVFYTAALELQRILGEVTLARTLAVPEVHRPGIEVVTTVFMPIHARTKHCWATAAESARLTDEDFKGFDVVADCAIEVKGFGTRLREERGNRYGSASWRPKGEVFSESGEYPMEMLGDLDLGHLMSIDSKLFAGDTALKKRLGGIVLARG